MNATLTILIDRNEFDPNSESGEGYDKHVYTFDSANLQVFNKAVNEAIGNIEHCTLFRKKGK